MAAKDEDGNVNADGNVNTDGEMEELLQEISIVRRSQAHEVESNLGEKKETTDTSDSCSLGVDGRSIQNISSDHQETSNERVTKAPVKNDTPLPDDEDVTNSIDYTSSEYDETRERLKKHFSLENDDSKDLSKIDPSSDLPLTQWNPRAMNPRHSQYQFPSGQYGNMTRPPYLPPPPYMPPSALPFPQHGGSNMAHYGTSPYWRPEQNDIYNYNMPQLDVFMDPYGNIMTSPYWVPEQNDIYNYNMPQLGAPMVPYGTMVPSPYWRPAQNNMPQLGAPIVPYPYGYANRFGTWRGNNPPNSSFGYEAGVSSNHLPSMQYHQGGDLNAWQPNQEHQEFWVDVSASVDQQNDRSDDPSDQTQQRSPPRGN